MTLAPSADSSRPDAGSNRLPVIELVVVTLARVVLNTAYRMVYPFLPAFSRGLGISTRQGALLVSARSAAGFASPLFGPVSDRFGRRAIMLLGLGMLALSMGLVPALPVFGVAMLAFVLMGLAKAAYDPGIQAYIGDRVSYDRRGLAMGAAELSWSLGLLVGAPLVGFSIQRAGWLSPFVGLAGLSLLAWLVVLALVRRDGGTSTIEQGSGPTRHWGLLWRTPAALGAMVFALLISLGNEGIFVVYGQWMESSFGLEVGPLGLLTAVIGVGEMGGELIVVTGADYVGKRRVMLAGLGVAAAAYVGLPWLGTRLPVAWALLFVMFVGVEAAIVASIPLVSELLPAARGTMMAAFLVAFAVGRTLGALLGGWLWEQGGLRLNGLVSATINVLAAVLVLTVVSEARTIQVVEVSDATG